VVAVSNCALCVKRSEIVEFLYERLEREPTKEEVDEFIDFVQNDLWEWLKDNFKAWLEVRRDE
jgi:cell division septum initiation protein DivIVA